MGWVEAPASLLELAPLTPLLTLLLASPLKYATTFQLPVSDGQTEWSMALGGYFCWPVLPPLALRVLGVVVARASVDSLSWGAANLSAASA